ncbi:ATP-binding cassette domain-containing protein, partial [Campylobacter sp. MRC_CM3]
MVEVRNLTMRFANQLLFENVNLKLVRGQRYGLIGANGAGKSTFLKILSGEIESSSGEVVFDEGLRIAVLGQDQFAFENYTIKDAVMCANKRLYEALKEKEKLYMSEEFTDE